MSSELWLGYIAGALTFGWLLPWIGREERKNMKLRKTVEMSIEEAQDDFCYRYETCG
ncbi:MAG: hypothetical protein ACLU9S_01330 [Oscillospiraceae bacterium]